MGRLVIFLWLLLAAPLWGETVKDHLVKGKAGDYVVVAQGKIYTLLALRSLSDKAVVIEEISVPESEIEPSKIVWKAWVADKAKGHTSWTSHQVDLTTLKIVKSYSYTRRAWLYAEDPYNFLPKFLSLALRPLPQNSQRRIGPAPPSGEEDHRKIWSPPITIEGKRADETALSPYSATWPQDGTLIGGCELHFYFGSFAFPYWMEIKTPHYTAGLRTVDTGSGITFPTPPI